MSYINSNLSGIGMGEPITTTLTLTSLLTKLKPVAKLIAGVKTLLSKLNIGGVDQDRFFVTYFDIRDIFAAGNYLVIGSAWHEAALTRHKIRQTQVRDNTTENYYPEFQRLRGWVIDVMDTANPGLGTDFGFLIPEFKMVNKGQIYRVYVDIIRDIVQAIPPGTYIPGTLLEVVKLETLPTGTEQAQQKPLITADGAYTIFRDAQGKITQIKDAAGRLLNPGTPEYNEAINKASTQSAGMGTLGVVLGLAAFVGTVLYMTKDGNDNGRTQKQKAA